MIKNSKQISILLSVCMTITMFMTACGGSSNTPTNDTPKSSDKASEKLSFKLTTVNFGESPIGTELHDEWLRLMSEKMGKELDIKMELINMGDYPEKLKVIVAGGSIPDVLTYGWTEKSDIDKYGDKGVFVDISKNLDKAPNYKNILEKDPNSKNTVYTPAGNLYAFYGVSYTSVGTAHAADCTICTVKNKVLKENNLEIPTTLEDMYEVAKVLKKNGVSKYPIIQHEEWQNPEGAVFKSYHTDGDRFFNGKNYEYGPLSDDYKDGLKYLNKIYTEGLISPDYFTHKVDNGNAAIADGSACIIPSSWEGYPGVWKTQYPEDEWVGVPQLSCEKYPNAWQFVTDFKSEFWLNTNYSAVISAKSKVKDDVIRFVDCGYSEEIRELLNWGIKDKHFTIDDDGNKHFLLKGEENKSKLVEAGFPASGTCRAGFVPQPSDRDLQNIEIKDSQPMFYDGKIQDVKLVPFSTENMNDDNTSPKDYEPMFSLTSDENEKYANIMTPVETFAKEQKVKFIKGTRSFDEWDKYIQELNKMGDINEAMELYNSKIK